MPALLALRCTMPISLRLTRLLCLLSARSYGPFAVGVRLTVSCPWPWPWPFRLLSIAAGGSFHPPPIPPVSALLREPGYVPLLEFCLDRGGRWPPFRGEPARGSGVDMGEWCAAALSETDDADARNSGEAELGRVEGTVRLPMVEEFMGVKRCEWSDLGEPGCD